LSFALSFTVIGFIVAMRRWEAARIIAALHRRPQTALLNFGVPFSE
jgi:hypothetical protein